MLKALVCLECNTIRSPKVNGEWTLCDCKRSAIKWNNPQQGKITVWSTSPTYVRVLGVMNSVLTSIASTDEEWRLVQETSVKLAEGYIFHESNRNCWAVIFKPGETSDSKWASSKDFEELRLILEKEVI
jgi:hypothetical protein